MNNSSPANAGQTQAMTIPLEIIELAVKGGWKHAVSFELPILEPNYIIYITDQQGRYGITYAEALLDPAFWQALGKACGWKTYRINKTKILGEYLNAWGYNAVRLYSLILQNKDTAPFWEEIITSADTKGV